MRNIKTNIKTRRQKGFTLLELLLVVSIVGLLSSIVMYAAANVRARARDAVRLENVKVLHKALELYYSDFGEYPKTFQPGNSMESLALCQDGEEEYIPGLAPKYIAQLPTDPILDCDGATHGWNYASNGIDFKLLVHTESTLNPQQYLDPSYDHGADECILDGPGREHFGVWTPAGACWDV